MITRATAVLLMIVASIAASSGAVPAQRIEPAKPDIVFILTDDQRWDTLWAMPRVQSLIAEKGVTFSNGFAVNPWCCPSRASILTGQYSHTTNVYRNAPPFGGFQSFDDSSTAATWLDAAGYRTGLFGKYLNGYTGRRAAYVPPGWDRWAAFTSQSGNGNYYNYSMSVNGTEVSYGALPEDYSTDILATEATQFIRNTPEGEPLFLMFTPNAPHKPAVAAPRHQGLFEDLSFLRPPSFNEADVADKPAYIQDQQNVLLDGFRRDQYRTLLAADEAVSSIVGALEETGRLSSTLLVFTSDNGLMWGEHRWRGKSVPYEESIRVPYVVRYDPLIDAPEVNAELVTNIDFAPTFAELAGLGAPAVEGKSLVPLLSSNSTPWRSSFLIENLAAQRGVPTYCAVRNEGSMYVVYETGERELYDLTQDPYQLENVAGSPFYAARRAAMHEQLRSLCAPPPPGFALPAE